jgi:hypothetical protein
MENTTFKSEPTSSPTRWKIQPWKTFSRKDGIPNRVMVDGKGPEVEEEEEDGDIIPGSAGEVNQDIEYDTGN